MDQQTPKRIPYGMQNWEDVRLSDCYYVDKTEFIPRIENAHRYFFFIRPRRFGKTLLMNMLRHYYDVRKADRFERLFGDLWVGSHPTPEHNQYLVLYLNFSLVSGGLDRLEERLDEHCRITMESFADKYADLLPQETMQKLEEAKGAIAMLNCLVQMCEKADQKMYLFIDEYDHFTNDILASPDLESQYRAVTHGTGVLRTFFNAIKGGAVSSIKRLFITGVSPVTMDDLTSGFNIGTNYTMDARFNAMVGFTEDEVRQMLDNYRQFYTFHHTTDQLIEAMKPWYDNYCFSPECVGDSPLYNSDMVLYFISSYAEGGGKMPIEMVDRNIRTDYNKLRMLIRKDRGFEHNASSIQHIVETGGIQAHLKDSFPAETVTAPDNFISLLYYFGMLTIAGHGVRGMKFRIPNHTVREQLYTYLMKTYSDNQLVLDTWNVRELMADMATQGLWLPFFRSLEDTLHRFASQRDKQKGEAFVHGFTLAATCLSNLYMPISELDTGPERGYADIYLQPMLYHFPDLEHSYVLELKYCRPAATDADVEQARRQATQQLLRYAEGETVMRTHQPTQLHRLILVWRGIDLVVAQEL